MRLVILKENIKKGLDIVGRAAGKNLTLPILSNVLIKTEKNLVCFQATNLELGIKYWTLAQIEQEGKITVPVKLLSDFISFLPDEKIILEGRGQNIFIECKNYKTKINGLNSDDFPIIPEVKTNDLTEINSSLFSRGISYVIGLCSLSQTRPEISGVFCDFQKEQLKIVSTDSFRLAEKTIYYEKGKEQEKEFSFILPLKTAQELMNILSEKEGGLKICFSPNQVLFDFLISETPLCRFQLTSRLIEGEYPNYQEIIPKDYKTQIILSKDDFLNKIKTASLFSGKINEVKIKTNKEKGEVEIFSQSPELGESRSFLPGKIDGEDTNVSFNFKFLLDGISNIKSKELIFWLNGDSGPAVLKPVGSTDYIYVVMPIKSS